MKLPRFYLIAFVGLAILWMLYFFCGDLVSHYLSLRIGEKITHATQGNVSEPHFFLKNRMLEGLSLITSLFSLAWLQKKFMEWKVNDPHRRWILPAVTGFIFCNLWLAFAMQSVLFWVVFWQGEATQPFTRFQLKRLLMTENRSLSKAIILGNSQANSQIDEGTLNEMLQPQLHLAELHFPGSRAYDVWLAHRQLVKTNNKAIIFYTSEACFYNGMSLEPLQNLFRLSDVKELFSSPSRRYLPTLGWSYGLLGSALPVFRLRDVLAQRILGPATTGIKQAEHLQAVAENAEVSAARSAKSFQINLASEFQFRALEQLAKDCAGRSEKLILLVGQINPTISRRIDPAIRKDMVSFFHQLRDQNPNVILLENLPEQTEADYEDGMHATKEVKNRFTKQLAPLLRGALSF